MENIISQQPLFRRILCAVDPRDDCLPAVELGRRLAERNRAALTLIHVLTPKIPGGAVLREDKERARASLERMVENALAGMEYDLIVQWGRPVTEILAAEERLGAELCVIPNSGSMGGSHLFRSTAERVARRSLCPVLTVGSKAA